MRRPLVYICGIGLAAALLAALTHALGWLRLPEIWIARLVLSGDNFASLAPGWHYLTIVVVAIGTAWLIVVSRGERRVGWLLLAVTAELFALMWVCSLYRNLFQPLPSLLAMLLSLAGAFIYLSITERARASVPLAIFTGKVSDEKLSQFRAGELQFQNHAASFETTVLVCDLADKYDLADTAEPSAVAEASDKFSRRATEFLLKAGAYLHAADGEGVVAIFGFPDATEKTAEKAIAAAFDLARLSQNDSTSSNGETAPPVGMHIGISSGTVIAAPIGEKPDLFIMGEPLELGRRFCMANRFYGTRVLIGPRTFELANQAVIARPIDFLSGVAPQERHEIYEPLALSADAPSELVARRDCFWNGIVFYREKRWAEAYAEFQKARSPDGEEDAPLNLYLRRLEPLALQLMESPGE